MDIREKKIHTIGQGIQRAKYRRIDRQRRPEPGMSVQGVERGRASLKIYLEDVFWVYLGVTDFLGEVANIRNATLL